MSRLTTLLFLISCAFRTIAQAPQFSNFLFERNQQVPVYEDDRLLKLPWTGGLNSVRFSEIDLNSDGLNDIFAFEKHGNRILTFVRQNDDFVYAPEYVRLFPDLHDWAFLHDFNNDGKQDVFTYGLGGIRVFQNVSSNPLTFSLIADPLNAFYYNGYVNLFASPDDYLVADDVDGDGKTDILNFYVLGKQVHFLKNYSDSGFDLRLEDECWGKFAEAADNNEITLFADCNARSDGQLRHTGSSMFLHDFDRNGLSDLLIGDVDSPHLILLYNNGTQQSALMTEQDTAFPAANPIKLYSMPAVSFLSLQNGAGKSLIASPSDPSLTKSQDLNSVWRYDFDTTLNQYTLVKYNFLQDEMIDVGSGCYPVLFDFDDDGLTDLFIANYGSFDSATFENGFLQSHFSSSISYYRNTGTAQNPEFTLQTKDFGRLKMLNHKALYPAFGDFDGDEKVDMLCGNSDGTLLLVPNQRLLSGVGTVISDFQSIDAGDFSTPQYFDLDGDGVKDLIVGNRRGKLSYYKNSSSQIPEFQKITDELGGVDVRDYDVSYFGYSVPCFCRDSIRGTVLFCASESGKISCFENIDGNLAGNFSLFAENVIEKAGNNMYDIKEGKRTGLAVSDLNADSFPDILIGNYAGGLAFFNGKQSPAGIDEHSAESSDFNLFPNPNSGSFSIVSDSLIEELSIFDVYGKVVYQSDNVERKYVDIVLKHAKNGIYFVRINDWILKKIIISRN